MFVPLPSSFLLLYFLRYRSILIPTRPILSTRISFIHARSFPSLSFILCLVHSLSRSFYLSRGTFITRHHPSSIHRKKMMPMRPPRSREVGQPSAAAMTERRRKNAKKNKDDDDHKNCSIMSFEGDYVFAKGCDGNSYHITISKRRMGYVYEGKPLYDGDSGKILNLFRIIFISRDTY